MTHRIASLAATLLALSPALAARAQDDGCGRDTDCKGNRICVNGQCVYPEDAPAPQAMPDPSQAPVEQAAAAPDSGDFQQFHDALAPYGNWYETPEYGVVWMPSGIGPDWRPYTRGRWDYTAYGWTWVGEEPWAWGPYHYGRWTVYPGSGWVWIPGYTWGPAWVSWRYGDAYAGWTPLEPGWAYGAAWLPSYPVYYDRWTFVSYGGFYGGGPVWRYAVAPDVVRTSIWVSTRPIGVVREGGVAFVGPSVQVVERGCGHPVRPVAIAAVGSPGARASGGIGFYAPHFHAAPRPFVQGRIVEPTAHVGVGHILVAAHVETQRFVAQAAAHPMASPRPEVRPANEGSRGGWQQPRTAEPARPNGYERPAGYEDRPAQGGYASPVRPEGQGGYHPEPPNGRPAPSNGGGYRPAPRPGVPVYRPPAPAPKPNKRRPNER
ncbi:MAG: DUF6600 domain-containing protein [Deltaproteobacteria bacterium]